MIKWIKVAIIIGLYVESKQSTMAASETTATSSHTVSECWTPWFNRDDERGSGDWEVIGAIYSANPHLMCLKPHEIEVRTAGDKCSPAGTGDVIFVSDTTIGFICLNSEQESPNRCHDYEVRFKCPKEFCKATQCWTEWFDRDDPGTSGDYETLKDLRISYPDKICCDPLEIDVETTDGLSVAEAGDVIASCDTTTGFACKTSEQPDQQCHDYRVQFRCPPDFCKCSETECWTDWFDSDKGTGTGDWETCRALQALYPGQICAHPLQIEVQTISGISVTLTGNKIYANDPISGFVCRNIDQPDNIECENYQVRFRCPDEFCTQTVSWTDWFDRGDPSVSSGDWELLNDLKIKYPGAICDKPAFIDVHTKDTHTPAFLTWQTFFIFDPEHGFACRNEDQEDLFRCHNYEVRFGCVTDA